MTCFDRDGTVMAIPNNTIAIGNHGCFRSSWVKDKRPGRIGRMCPHMELNGSPFDIESNSGGDWR